MKQMLNGRSDAYEKRNPQVGHEGIDHRQQQSSAKPVLSYFPFFVSFLNCHISKAINKACT